jgi:integrase
LTSHKSKHHAAILDPRKAGELLRAIDGYDRHPVTRLALQLAALVFVHPGELRHAEWSEIGTNFLPKWKLGGDQGGDTGIMLGNECEIRARKIWFSSGNSKFNRSPRKPAVILHDGNKSRL